MRALRTLIVASAAAGLTLGITALRAEPLLLPSPEATTIASPDTSVSDTAPTVGVMAQAPAAYVPQPQAAAVPPVVAQAPVPVPVSRPAANATPVKAKKVAVRTSAPLPPRVQRVALADNPVYTPRRCDSILCNHYVLMGIGY